MRQLETYRIDEKSRQATTSFAADAHWHVLLLGEDGIVGLETILFQVSLRVVDLDVELQA
jgi:hypothetical protein